MGLLKKSKANEIFDAYKESREALRREQENARRRRESLTRKLKLQQEHNQRQIQAAKRKLAGDLKEQITKALEVALDGYNATFLSSKESKIIAELERLKFSIGTFIDENKAAENGRARIYSQTIEARNPAIINQLNNLKYELEIQLAKMTGKPERWVRENLVTNLFKDIDREVLSDHSDELNETLQLWITLPFGRYIEAKRLFKNCDHLGEIRDLTFNETFVKRFSYYAILLARAINRKQEMRADPKLSSVRNCLLLSDRDADVADAGDEILITWRNPYGAQDSNKIDAYFLLWVASKSGQEFVERFNNSVDVASRLQKKRFTLDRSVLKEFDNYCPSMRQMMKALKMMGYEVEIGDNELHISFE
jgi:hypothetical protein